jgi:hypothetical protein
VRNDVAGLLQIGITNNYKRRIREHRRTGFHDELDAQYNENGFYIQELEKDLKRLLARCLGHPLNARIDDMIFAGYTESWISSEFGVASLSELRTRLYTSEMVTLSV